MKPAAGTPIDRIDARAKVTGQAAFAAEVPIANVAHAVIVGSTMENVGYEKRVTSGGLEKILSAANEMVPELAAAELIETWSGLRPGTPDQLPILGPVDVDGLVFATGHYRNGILLAPVTAKLVGEWITERRTSLDWDAFSSVVLKSVV